MQSRSNSAAALGNIAEPEAKGEWCCLLLCNAPPGEKEAGSGKPWVGEGCCWGSGLLPAAPSPLAGSSRPGNVI